MIANLLDYNVRDEAHIGGMNVNDVATDGDCVIIRGCESVTVQAKVSALHVSVDISDEIVDDVPAQAYLGGRI